MSRIDTAMILAAGRGERMRDLTLNTPKPMLKLGDRALIEHVIARLSEQSIHRLVINTAYLGEQIERHLGDGHHYHCNIHYSRENPALETAGGIVKALSLIARPQFLVCNADVFIDRIPVQDMQIKNPNSLACLLLVPNPEHHSDGDFHFCPRRNLLLSEPETDSQRVTFAGIACYKQTLFAEIQPGHAALGPLLRKIIADGRAEAHLHRGIWWDIGTPERLQECQNQFFRHVSASHQ